VTALHPTPPRRYPTATKHAGGVVLEHAGSAVIPAQTHPGPPSRGMSRTAADECVSVASKSTRSARTVALLGGGSFDMVAMFEIALLIACAVLGLWWNSRTGFHRARQNSRADPGQKVWDANSKDISGTNPLTGPAAPVRRDDGSSPRGGRGWSRWYLSPPTHRHVSDPDSGHERALPQRPRSVPEARWPGEACRCGWSAGPVQWCRLGATSRTITQLPWPLGRS
jgi:hypothetical protein